MIARPNQALYAGVKLSNHDADVRHFMSTIVFDMLPVFDILRVLNIVPDTTIFRCIGRELMTG